MKIRRLFAGIMVTATLSISPLPVYAENPVPDSICHVECEKIYEQEAGVCGRIAAEKESQQCGTEANHRYTKCCDECTEMLTKCEDRCHEDYNDKVKMCNKIPDRVTRAKCQQVAAEQMGDCIRKCRRKKRNEN